MPVVPAGLVTRLGSFERLVDELARIADVRAVVGQGRQPLRIEVIRHAVARRETVAERSVAPLGGHRGLVNHLVGGLPADVLGQRHHHCLGSGQSTVDIEVLQHPVGTDFQPF